MAIVAEANGVSPLLNGDMETSSSQESMISTNGTISFDSNHSNHQNGENEVTISQPKQEPASEQDHVPWSRRIRSNNNETNPKRDKSMSVSKAKETKPKEEITTPSSGRGEDDRSWADRVKSKREVKKEVEDPTFAKSKNKHKLKKRKMNESSEDEDYGESDADAEYAPKKKKLKTSETKKSPSSAKKSVQGESKQSGKKKKTNEEVEKQEPSSSAVNSPVKKRKKAEEEEEVWRWWEDHTPDQPSDGTIKWRTLEHMGPVFAPSYVPLPKNVKLKYDGKEMELSEAAEEVASFYAKMLDHEYTSKPTFNKNFFHDWRKVMTRAEKEKIADLAKCDFKQMHAYFTAESEKRKARSKEEKKAEKDVKDNEAKEYGFAMLDGYKQKIGNFRIEPPGLFRGRGDHPKMGSLKRRVRPEDVIINCSKGVKIAAPEGHKWKEVRHDNTVTWLCSWTENVLGNNKYIMLNPSSKLKGQKDWEKFEKARKLKSYVGQIREQYNSDFKSKEMRVRQRAVALYFIDKLALRAGNEKDTDEAADTVGCCSLRCEHIKLHEQLDDQKYVVEFDFLGKDSIRYYNRVPVEKQVFKNLKIFMDGKEPGDDLFDRLDTSSLNQYLKELMDGLTAKVFRTYNASITLQEQLDKLTNPDETVHEKLLSYNRANRQVAILCNHQRAVPKSHEKSMENLENKIKEKKKELKEMKSELKNDMKNEKLRKKYERVKEQVAKLKTQRTDKDENKQIALGTSKLNYLDPRISVAWCKKYDVPVEKIFSKTQRDKFRWAIDMAKEDFVF